MGDVEGKQCDYGIIQRKENCDVYIKIFIDDELDYETPKHVDQQRGTFTFNYRTPRINKKTPIRFEMWDDDSGFLGTKDDLLLSKTLTVEELIKQKSIVTLTAPTTYNKENRIEIVGSVWKDEHQQS